MTRTAESEMSAQIEERTKLAEELSDCEPGGFPGSAAYRRESAAMAALSAFDKAHPEVIAEIKKRHAAKYAK